MARKITFVCVSVSSRGQQKVSTVMCAKCKFFLHYNIVFSKIPGAHRLAFSRSYILESNFKRLLPASEKSGFLWDESHSFFWQFQFPVNVTGELVSCSHVWDLDDTAWKWQQKEEAERMDKNCSQPCQGVWFLSISSHQTWRTLSSDWDQVTIVECSSSLLTWTEYDWRQNEFWRPASIQRFEL